MRLLIVEDDPKFGAALHESLLGEGFSADWARCGSEVGPAMAACTYDCVLLDPDLPDLSGEETLRTIRAAAAEPSLIVITARRGVTDRIRLLDLGADDYLTKPVDLAEVAARVRAVTRRARAVRSTPPLRHGPLQLDLARRSVTWRDEPVPVTDKEFGLLEAFVRGGQRVHPRAALQAAIYDLGEEASSNTIEVYVHFLRRKFGPRLIRTVRGSGYQIAPEESLRD